MSEMILEFPNPKTKTNEKLSIKDYLDRIFIEDEFFNICHIDGKDSLTMSPCMPQIIVNTKGSIEYAAKFVKEAGKSFQASGMS